MKKIISGLLAIHIAALCSPQCMDNSYHLTKRCDNKNYHHVVCNCPCEKQYKILANRGQCIKCKHYRDPSKSSIFIEKGTIQCPVRIATRICNYNCYPKELFKCKG